MADQIVTQKFNDDLLLNLDVRENARLAFPSMFHVPDDEELRALIETFEKPADRAKRQSLRAGIMAVLLVVIALFVTSAERLYEDYPWSGVAAIGAGILGAVGVLIGVFGLIIGKAKKEWLCQRMASELLRQFHFQIFVCRTIDVFKSLTGKTEQDLFLKQRKIWLSEFKVRFLPHLEAELHALLQRDQGSGIWLHPAPSVPDDTVLRGLPEEFFSAYAVFRIRHQLQFVDWKLRHGQPVFSDFSPQSLETILANGSLIATLALVVTEIFIALALLPSVSPSWAHGFSPWAHWIAICFAVVALGMRTLEEGLQPKRELERYERYGALIQDILDRFEAGSRSVRFEAMVEMERLSFEEMRDFLRSAYEARFVM